MILPNAPVRRPAPPRPRPQTEHDAADRPRLTTRKGIGPFHALMVPGLVPDGEETFLRVRGHFLLKGDVSILTYPYRTFRIELLLEGIHKFLQDCRRTKKRPLLVGVSVGGGFVLEYLRRAAERQESPDLSGVVLISPLSCPQDLAPILRRLWNPIVATEGDSTTALEKGRSFFRQLASKSARTSSKTVGWRKILQAFTPQGLGELMDASVRARIEKTLESIPAQGAIARCLALRDLRGLDATCAPLCTAPTLVLWGSKERHTLDIDGPGARILCRPDLAEKHFPDVQVQWVYGKKGESIPHASLLKHDKAFAPLLRAFLARV
jgi:pimeloyl-ACP methyl ester carboxylesterase